MSQPQHMDPARRLSEDEAHGVLARAAEIDVRAPHTVSVGAAWAISGAYKAVRVLNLRQVPRGAA